MTDLGVYLVALSTHWQRRPWYLFVTPTLLTAVRLGVRSYVNNRNASKRINYGTVSNKTHIACSKRRVLAS